MYKFNGFTEKANKAINLAIEGAQELGHTYVGSEHILLGLLRCGDGAAFTVLDNSGANEKDLVRLISENIGVGDKTRLTPQDFTPRTKQVLQNAVVQASRMGHSYVGTEHILMALISDEQNYAVRFLVMMDVSGKDIVRGLNEILGQQEEADEGDYPQNDGLRKSADAKGGSTKMLDKFGRDLTAAAAKGEIDPVIGRQEEIERVIQILSF